MVTMQRREYMLSTIGVLGAATVGSIAYTSASVDRSITSNIAEDQNAIIGLTPGSPAAVTQNSDGQLIIDTAEGESSGINTEGTFKYGDDDDPESTYAFSITNNDEDTHDLTVGLTDLELPGDASFTVSIYESADTGIGDVTPNNDVTQTGWEGGSTLYAILTVDTTGTTSSNSLSGTLNFNAVASTA